MNYEPNFESVSQHPVPEWFHNAKLGIFIHWGLYSVPAWAYVGMDLGELLEGQDFSNVDPDSDVWKQWFAHNAYAEWYLNTLRIDDSPTQKHHAKTYGADFDYFDFVPMFNEAIKAWNPDEWADLFKQVNARYVVLTTKHHDGFLLWPSLTPNPHRENYHATRDLVGELGQAVRSKGLKMAYYYSGGVDWTFNPTVVTGFGQMAETIPQMPEYVEYANAHWCELIDRYETAIMWNDIAYPKDTDLNVLFAEYYNKMPDGLINNRFIQDRNLRLSGDNDNHHDFVTPEYTSFSEIQEKKWESCRGIGHSFGYNQIEGSEEHLTVEELVRSFVDIVSKDGNLLLNVGPTADGTIPDLQRERLLGLGQWLDANGEAIFETRPWKVAEGTTDVGVDLRFTQANDALYATLMETPSDRSICLKGLTLTDAGAISLLGQKIALDWQQSDSGIVLTLPDSLPNAPAHSLKIVPQPELST
ncbi:alpha-L-fucosidase [Chloroflexi bacterium TSY]|nr:alpha-L-fucosidase [Chloroflexi bacterium TSY]